MKQCEEAIARCNLVILSEPKNPKPYYERSICYERLGMYEAALNDSSCCFALAKNVHKLGLQHFYQVANCQMLMGLLPHAKITALKADLYETQISSVERLLARKTSKELRLKLSTLMQDIKQQTKKIQMIQRKSEKSKEDIGNMIRVQRVGIKYTQSGKTAALHAAEQELPPPKRRINTAQLVHRNGSVSGKRTTTASSRNSLKRSDTANSLKMDSFHLENMLASVQYDMLSKRSQQQCSSNSNKCFPVATPLRKVQKDKNIMIEFPHVKESSPPKRFGNSTTQRQKAMNEFHGPGSHLGKFKWDTRKEQMKKHEQRYHEAAHGIYMKKESHQLRNLVSMLGNHDDGEQVVGMGMFKASRDGHDDSDDEDHERRRKPAGMVAEKLSVSEAKAIYASDLDQHLEKTSGANLLPSLFSSNVASRKNSSNVPSRLPSVR